MGEESEFAASESSSNYYNIICCNAANYIIVILDNLLVFRMTIPDAVLIQIYLMRMSKILIETCRGL
jgi:hypothetical protein